MRGALSKEIENRSKMSYNSCLSWIVIFLGRKKKCVGVGISGGEPPWAHEVGGAPRGWARPGPSWPGACSPCCVLGARYSQIFQKKSYFNFEAFGELLFSGYFFIARTEN